MNRMVNTGQVCLTQVCLTLICMMLVCAPAVCLGAEQELTVKGGDPVEYGCDNNVAITARYYQLSDDSLSFVKVRTPDGKTYTLPQLVSGSGVRFSDEFQLLWWTKGDTAFAQKIDDKGEWRTVYDNCRETSD